jgi:hypothetical protein
MKLLRNPGLPIGLLLVLAFAGCSGSGTDRGAPPATAEETVKWVAAGLSDNDPTVVWDALPASYQADVVALLHEFAGKVDREVWEKSVSVLQGFSGVLGSKKEYWLNSNALPDDFRDAEVEAGWDSMVGFMDTLFHSELSDLDALQELDVRRFLAGTGASLLEQGRALTALSPEAQADVGWNKLSQLAATKVGEADGVVTVKIEIPGENPSELGFIQVEERWVPQEMADDWTEDVAWMRESLAEMDPAASGQNTTQIKMFLSMLEGFIAQLDAAGSQEEFDRTLSEGGAPLLFGAMMMGAEAE